MRRIVKLVDLTPEQRAIVLALVAAKEAADERSTGAVTDPIPRAPDSAVFARVEHD